MTDRYHALTVTLEKPIRVDDAEAIIEAVKMIKGVANVVPAVTNIETHWAKEAATRELTTKLWQVLHPDYGKPSSNDDE